ncbi:uncharacterized protein BP5553_10109 [Venustampulla echinocandica]|uniref:Uncharacterized protein n=1 Tax=Venustampulla echinocandica TaxID=2656787 RepID=A0A370TAC6_9HELO|nr:uncharacterized protein BP5553_10109 [Venustampulla echinocandica]RDL30764.1 hypothetical protein BP5553_10109 [Venustampulla echinocandica]
MHRSPVSRPIPKQINPKDRIPPFRYERRPTILMPPPLTLSLPDSIPLHGIDFWEPSLPALSFITTIVQPPFSNYGLWTLVPVEMLVEVLAWVVLDDLRCAEVFVWSEKVGT